MQQKNASAMTYYYYPNYDVVVIVVVAKQPFVYSALIKTETVAPSN